MEGLPQPPDIALGNWSFRSGSGGHVRGDVCLRAPSRLSDAGSYHGRGVLRSRAWRMGRSPRTHTRIQWGVDLGRSPAVAGGIRSGGPRGPRTVAAGSGGASACVAFLDY